MRFIRVRVCVPQQVAKFSDPQSCGEYEALIGTLYKKAKAHRGLHQQQQEEVCERGPGAVFLVGTVDASVLS